MHERVDKCYEHVFNFTCNADMSCTVHIPSPPSQFLWHAPEGSNSNCDNGSCIWCTVIAATTLPPDGICHKMLQMRQNSSTKKVLTRSHHSKHFYYTLQNEFAWDSTINIFTASGDDEVNWLCVIIWNTMVD